MQIIKTSISDLLLIKLKSFADDRGYFTERYNKKIFTESGIKDEFVQDNYSMSYSSVVRGLHMQKGQAKLVGVISGTILDIAVDMRPGSATYGKYEKFILSSDGDQSLVYIPDGFAHGFANISSDNAHLYYKVSSLYDPKLETGVRWNDPDIAVDWGIDDPIISERDNGLEFFRDIKV